MGFRGVRTLRIGGVSKKQLLGRLCDASIQLNDYADNLFADARFTTFSNARDVCLAVVSLEEIGLPKGGMFADILSQAAIWGLAPCPLEVAPHLRLSDLRQREGPYLTVASLPVAQDAVATGFYLRRRPDGLWLRGYIASADHHYAPDFTEFVFLCAQPTRVSLILER